MPHGVSHVSRDPKGSLASKVGRKEEIQKEIICVISVVAGRFFNQNGTVELLVLEHIGTHFEMKV